jgi:hypothetical protein
MFKCNKHLPGPMYNLEKREIQIEKMKRKLVSTKEKDITISSDLKNESCVNDHDSALQCICNSASGALLHVAVFIIHLRSHHNHLVPEIIDGNWESALH